MSHLLQVEQLKKYFKARHGKGNAIRALDDVSFQIQRGETLGLVGESGSGKSTLGRTILRLLEPNDGKILFEGQNILHAKPKEMSALRKEMQIVFQDPYGSLHPRMTVQRILEEPLRIHESIGYQERKEKVIEMLELVGLSKEQLHRYPHQFSGGQRQRIGIARALMLNPKFIVCDEPVSALDVSVQSQIINLLCDLQERFQLTYLFIAHGLNVVKHVSDRVAVMYLGKIVEIGKTSDVYAHPKHPYTQALLSAIPVHGDQQKRERIILQGEIPSPANPPLGCRFSTRCPHVMPVCKEIAPELKALDSDQLVACHLFE